MCDEYAGGVQYTAYQQGKYVQNVSDGGAASSLEAQQSDSGLKEIHHCSLENRGCEQGGGRGKIRRDAAQYLLHRRQHAQQG